MVARKVAAIYDIHGNYVALETVLEEIHKYNVDAILIGGDLAWGPEPFEVMERLMTLKDNVYFIRGNADREVANKYGAKEGLDQTIADINLWCVDQLTDTHLDFLKALPDNQILTIEGLGETLFVHGSPRSDEECIRFDTPEVEINSMIQDVSQEIIVCGHTHTQFDRFVSSKRIINPGSVGLPSKARGACWALISEKVELKEIIYNTEKAAERIRKSGVPYAEEFVSHILNPPNKGP
jgi:putative phosphoesterase